MSKSKETVGEKDKQPSESQELKNENVGPFTPPVNGDLQPGEVVTSKLGDEDFEVADMSKPKKSVTIGIPGRGKIPNREIAREKMMERKMRNGRHIPQKYKQSVHTLRVAENELVLAKANHEKAEVVFKKSEKTDSDKSIFTAAADRLESAMKSVKEAEANLSLVREQLSA